VFTRNKIILINLMELSGDGCIPVQKSRRHRRRTVRYTKHLEHSISYLISRLLYVAATRAQGLLYMTHCGKRMIRTEAESRELTPFVSLPLKDAKVDIQFRFL
jgi:ATP-dependent exoDNAse (exonuclease V) beta subunit